MVRVCFTTSFFSLSLILLFFFLTPPRHVEELERSFNYERTFNYTTKKTAMEAFRPEPPVEYLNLYAPEMWDSFRKIWRINVWNENYELNLKASKKTQDNYNKRYFLVFFFFHHFYPFFTRLTFKVLEVRQASSWRRCYVYSPKIIHQQVLEKVCS